MTPCPIRPISRTGMTTENLPPVFASPAALRAAFEEGLSGLLAQDGLGGFILVLANASCEQPLFDRLRGPLTDAFVRWCGRFDRQDDAAIAAAPDDVAVFQRLRELGLDQLAVTRWTRRGPWELQFNPLRALRPPRISDAAVSCLQRPFAADAFHFNRPFLRNEILWEGRLAGAPVRLLYNKFPFAELHGLLVPDPLACRPQFLDQVGHALAWAIVARLGRTLAGAGLAYNAYGAYASVNHLHFQLFVRSSGSYPIEAACWRHNDGPQPYPLTVHRHADRDTAWATVRDLHDRGQAYNLLYRPGRIYIVERAQQGSYRHSDWTSGFAWSEVAGAVTTFDAAAFARVTAADIESEFARLSVRP